jgi:hypothetical protein
MAADRPGILTVAASRPCQQLPARSPIFGAASAGVHPRAPVDVFAFCSLCGILRSGSEKLPLRYGDQVPKKI